MLLVCAPLARALEHVTLRNGFEFDCVRREVQGDKMRLFFASSAQQTQENFIDVPAASVVRIETLPDPPALPTPVLAQTAARPLSSTAELLAHAGAIHHIDAELLAAVVHAESGGHANAVSRAGAQGLMQLMPGTAAALGVKNAFEPGQNVEGGTSYLDQLLTRYHDDIALALAAYNAGPGAVDRYHGVPPYRETRAYVARIITEFNKRKTAVLARAATLQVAAK